MTVFFLCKQKTAYWVRISDWSSDVCSSDVRVEGVLVRGMTVPDIRSNETLGGKVLQGSLNSLTAGSGNVALGSELARNLGAQVGSNVTIINPQGRATPFGTVPREISYRVSAIFESCVSLGTAACRDRGCRTV